MKKSELISILEGIPGDPAVAIIDAWRVSRAIEVEGADQTSKGIHENFDIQYFHGTDIPEGNSPFIGISFFDQPQRGVDFSNLEQAGRVQCAGCKGTGVIRGFKCKVCKGAGYHPYTPNNS